MSLFSLNRNELLKLALTMVGKVPEGQNPTVDQYQKAGDVVNMIHSDFMNADHPLIQFELKSAVVSTASFTLDEEDEDIALIYVKTGDSAYHPMTRVSYVRYYEVSDKTASGHPYLFYLDIQGTRVCYLYPVPDGLTIEYLALKRFQELKASTDIPLDSRYYKWLTYECAVMLCDIYQASITRTDRLAREAKRLRKKVSARDKYSNPSFRKGHYSGY